MTGYIYYQLGTIFETNKYKYIIKEVYEREI